MDLEFLPLPQTGKIVIIKWEDAKDADFTWCDADDVTDTLNRELIVTSIGWLVGRSDTAVVLAADKTGDGDCGRVTRIPRSMIVSVKEL